MFLARACWLRRRRAHRLRDSRRRCNHAESECTSIPRESLQILNHTLSLHGAGLVCASTGCCVARSRRLQCPRAPGLFGAARCVLLESAVCADYMHTTLETHATGKEGACNSSSTPSVSPKDAAWRQPSLREHAMPSTTISSSSTPKGAGLAWRREMLLARACRLHKRRAHRLRDCRGGQGRCTSNAARCTPEHSPMATAMRIARTPQHPRRCRSSSRHTD
mmetsp:Transcript_115876/g.368433  ORF Transcript_115876/g.368433 Transcript_115876/m.368433 type:complete len:221 (-) Transcript_115876:2-664(-)